MNKIIRLLSFVLIFILLFLLLVIAIPDQFGESYQRAIVRQYDYFSKLNSGKIVFLGPSSLAFGLDADYMSELTGEPCAILGNHMGHGLPFVMEMSKTNLLPGDTVVVEYVNYPLGACGPEYVLSGIGKRYEMYRFIIPLLRKSMLQGYPSYIKKSINYWLNGGYHPKGEYSIHAFDEKGNMTILREGTLNPYPYTDPQTDLSCKREFEQEYIDYINDYVEWCKNKGITVLFACMPSFDESVINIQFSDSYDSQLQDVLDAPLVTKTSNYLFSREYSQQGTHLNTAGARIRTERLYNDIRPYLG